MDFQQMQYIIKLAQTESLVKTARQCEVALSTLSRMLERLETELGAPLFFKTHNRYYPTPTGTVYIHAAQQMIRIMQQTKESIQSISAREKENIIFGASAFNGTNLVAAAFRDLFSSYPSARVEIRECGTRQCAQWIRDGVVDMGFISINDMQATPDPLDWIYMERSEMVAEIPLFHPIAQRLLKNPIDERIVHIREMKSVPLILLSRGTFGRKLLDTIMEENGVSPTIVYETTNINLLHILAQQGMGISLQHAHNVLQWETEATLIAYLKPTCSVLTGIGYLKGKKLTAIERELIWQIRQNLPMQRGVYPSDHILENDFLNRGDQGRYE